MISVSADDLLCIALHKIWLNADKFDEPGELTPERQEQNFLAWCGKLINRVCIDELSKFDQEEVRDELFWDFWPDLEQDTPSNPRLREAFQEAFERLSPKSRTILLATAYHTNPCARHKRIPPKENRELAARLGMTPDAVRKARERAYDFIRDFINSKGIPLERNPSK